MQTTRGTVSELDIPKTTIPKLLYSIILFVFTPVPASPDVAAVEPKLHMDFEIEFLIRKSADNDRPLLMLWAFQGLVL